MSLRATPLDPPLPRGDKGSLVAHAVTSLRVARPEWAWLPGFGATATPCAQGRATPDVHRPSLRAYLNERPASLTTWNLSVCDPSTTQGVSATWIRSFRTVGSWLC